MKKRSRKYDGPSAESLKEMPETDFETAKFFHGRGPEAFDNARKFFAIVRGRPRKGEHATGSKARSLRLPDAAWAELEKRAKNRKMSVHKLLRLLVAEHLYTSTMAARRKASTKRRARKAA